MAKGWFRDKDENLTCQEGYLKGQKTRQESRDDLGVEADFDPADLLFNHHL
ncbi:MAG: hypothetical protein ABSC91_11955 [Candidatus Bathyarchaeia archaeon]|jgi:hypothetical protein